MVASVGIEEGAVGEKGLRAGALGFVSSVVIGVASTAPGYSLAASLGLVTAVVGFQAPAIMWLAFIPMLFVAAAYYYMNRADPDCGTTFSWVTRAFGPYAGWLGGWAIIVADIIVMANLSQIAGSYSFLLFGADSLATNTLAVTLVGVAWIIVMTAICYIGVELSAKTQWYLLGAEVLTLFVFAVVAIIRVYVSDPEGAVGISIDWLNPFSIPGGSAALSAGVLTAVFIYWGWDSTVTVNEESSNPNEGPGKAAVVSTLLLVLIYVVVSLAAQAFHGPDFLTDNSDDVLGALAADVLPFGFDKLLIIAVLTSAAASTQTTILPQTRTMLSMAAKKAMPGYFGRIHPRYLSPSTATIWTGILSIAWYVILTAVSEDVLFDSIAALGLMIAFYLGITGIACAWYFRRELRRNVKALLLAGILPFVGGGMLMALFVKSVYDLRLPENSESGASWFGLGPPLVIAIAFLILGVVLMLLQRVSKPEFFRRKAEVADPAVLRAGYTPTGSGD